MDRINLEYVKSEPPKFLFKNKDLLGKNHFVWIANFGFI